MHHVLEDDRVDVLAQQVEQEPIAHDRLLDDDLHALGFYPPIANLKKVGTKTAKQADEHSIDDHEEREPGQHEHPKPQENVNLFVENIKWQNAEGVVFLDLARCAKLVEGAFGHSGEDVDHGVDAVLLVPIGE